MSPRTRSFRTVYNHHDPGPESLDLDPESQDSDVEMTERTMEDGEEVEGSDIMEHDPVSNVAEDRIIIAIDFGTTFSSVAYIVLPKGLSPENTNVRQVKCVGNYPGYEPPPGIPDIRQDVPTELWYDDGRLGTQRYHTINGADDDQSSDSENENSSGSEESLSEREQSQFDNDGGLKVNAATQRRRVNTTPATQYWGFSVQQKLSMTHIPRNEAQPLTRFKLNLDQEEETKELRGNLMPTLKALRKRKIIKRDNDIYGHYLTHLLKHTKEQLLLSNEFNQDMLVQFVLCVPAKWPMNACRIMQTALEEAVREAGMGERADCSVHNMFMISEPEAAAEFILTEARSELYCGETVVIVDAGGGTVDAVTYKCANEEPLRLSAEVVAPDSKLCGASYINERFEAKLLQELKEEQYLVKNGKTLKSIVQSKTIGFENNDKRRVDVSDKNAPRLSIYIDDLKENPMKHFYQNQMELRRKTVNSLFRKSLKGVECVLQSQLELAESAGHHVQKVILTGGFGQSPSLQSHLKKYLKHRMNPDGLRMDLIVPTNPSTAVAKGAVLRALNKRLGPSRITQCSYGFLLSEPYEPEVYEEHRRTRCNINEADGERYVDDTIHWLIQAGESVKNMQEFSFEMRHTFPITWKELICAEQLWMSDQRHPLHYRKKHTLNKGAEMVGSIEANLTFLKDRGLIEPQFPSEFSTYSSSQKQYWEVQYELAMIVEGRSIRFEARWPLKSNLEQGQNQQVLVAKLVGIAAAFQPGTA